MSMRRARLGAGLLLFMTYVAVQREDAAGEPTVQIITLEP